MLIRSAEHIMASTTLLKLCGSDPVNPPWRRLGKLAALQEHWKARTMFTLIELLVVIAIISILMAMLLPALKGARDQVKSIACVSQLKQYGLCTQNYLDDYQGRIFPVWTAGVGEWCRFATDFPHFKALGYYKSSNTTYNWLLCPSRPNTVYSLNSQLVNYSAPIFYKLSGTDMSSASVFSQLHPEKRPTFCDAPAALGAETNDNACYYYVSKYSSRDGWSYSRILHRNNFNLVYLDGHAGSQIRYNVDVPVIWAWDSP